MNATTRPQEYQHEGPRRRDWYKYSNQKCWTKFNLCKYVIFRKDGPTISLQNPRASAGRIHISNYGARQRLLVLCYVGIPRGKVLRRHKPGLWMPCCARCGARVQRLQGAWRALRSRPAKMAGGEVLMGGTGAACGGRAPIWALCVC